MPFEFHRPILYLITRGATSSATTSSTPDFKQLLDQIAAAVAAGIDLIQLREKALTSRVLFELTAEAARLTRNSATLLLVNDRADIAVGAGADGVHLTTRSLDASTVRRTFGAKLLIGASTHSFAEAIACREGADFIVFGPVFTPLSKIDSRAGKGVDELKHVALTLAGFPVLALGGVTEQNIELCLEAGAAGVAGITLFSDPRTSGATGSDKRDEALQ